MTLSLDLAPEAERAHILERTNEGRIEAKAKDIKFGRKRSIDRQKVALLRTEGMGKTAIASQLNMGRSTVYKILENF